MLGAARAYQANLAAIGLIRDMVAKALELGTISHGDIAPRRHRLDRTAHRVAARAQDAPRRTRGVGADLRRVARASWSTSVEKTAANANDAVIEHARQAGDVHDAMIALQRAEMTLQLTVQIRNKLVQAYQDIMRMPDLAHGR